MRPWHTLLVSLITLFAILAPAGNLHADAKTDSPKLLNKYQQLKTELAHSPFGAPITLSSEEGDNHAKGEVYAVLETPFQALATILKQASQWCELAILHINIKTCTYRADQVNLFVGRKYYQTPSQARPLQYRFQALAHSDDYLHIQLSAAEGPFDTEDYLIRFEATPIDEQRSFIRFQYHYKFGWIAKLAMNTYLATLGRKKVGFTVTGKDSVGQPIYIKGIQGVVERNVMRYLLAIQAILETSKSPRERRQITRFMRWYTHTSKYPIQLVELSREKYLNNKKRELSNQRSMQANLQDRHRN